MVCQLTLCLTETLILSHFWRSLKKSLGTRLKFNTVYHLQTDGQSEQTIQILEDILRACMLDFKGSWEDHLHLAEFAYNNSYQVIEVDLHTRIQNFRTKNEKCKCSILPQQQVAMRVVIHKEGLAMEAFKQVLFYANING